MLRRTTLAAAGLAALMSGCAALQGPVTVAETAARTPELSTLSRLIADAGLAETLRGSGPFTVFAPTDEAFKAVPAATMAELARNKELLRSVLTYHVLPGKVVAAEVKVGTAKTLQGAQLGLGKAGQVVTVEDAMVVKADVAATNGVLHLVDRVLMPPRR